MTEPTPEPAPELPPGHRWPVFEIHTLGDISAAFDALWRGLAIGKFSLENVERLAGILEKHGHTQVASLSWHETQPSLEDVLIHVLRIKGEVSS
jgi:hypothetical protein